MKLKKDKLFGFIWLVVCTILLCCYTAWIWGDYIQTRIDNTPCGGYPESFWCPFSWFPYFNILHLPWELAVILPIYAVILIICLVFAWIGAAMVFKKEEAIDIEGIDANTPGAS